MFFKGALLNDAMVFYPFIRSMSFSASFHVSTKSERNA